ncbi:MAG: hypothetical protein MZV49_15385 [Rhodopseudomonas palustris]|nr:hypothetical protein [Rhodopseudomonas palustris]
MLIDGAMGFSYGAESSENLIEAAVTSARYQFKDGHNRIPEPKTGYSAVESFDPEVASMSPDDCISRAVSLEGAARQADPRVEKIRKASFPRFFPSPDHKFQRNRSGILHDLRRGIPHGDGQGGLGCSVGI